MTEILETRDWVRALTDNYYCVLAFTKTQDNDLWLAMKPEMETLASECQGLVHFSHMDSTNAPGIFMRIEMNRYPVICYFINTKLVKVVQGIRGYYGLRHDLSEAFGLEVELETKEAGCCVGH